jgi:exodeoxyribonuclease VII large subunit
MSGLAIPDRAPRIWQVGPLCRAIADALDARFNPVAVSGELSGFARASSGHCYFSLKDPGRQDGGQIRCAVFRRAASLLDFQPCDGELVEVRGRVDIYGPRGDLQLIVESMTRAGRGMLFEQFFQLKARLEQEGLFDPARKRPLPAMPRGIGVVTSLGAAALHDVATTLQRRAPHVPVVLVNALVQGANAAADMVQALSKLYLLAQAQRAESPGSAARDLARDVPGACFQKTPPVDLILVVRGGGSPDDLWAFNDERLARMISQSPVPVVTGVGHETDFTIADFCADLRAPTPTAAAELAARPRQGWVDVLETWHHRMTHAVHRRLDHSQQRLDGVTRHLLRPTAEMARQRLRLSAVAARMQKSMLQNSKRSTDVLQGLGVDFPRALRHGLSLQQQRLERSALRLQSVDPRRVLERGYAWLADSAGQAITRAAQTRPGQTLRAELMDGPVDLTVSGHPGPGSVNANSLF